MMNKINLLLVDNHQIMIDGIKSLFENVSTIDVVGEATNGKQALEKLNCAEVDVVLMDIEMPVMNGFCTAQMIKAEYPNIKVITFTTHRQGATVNKMKRAGVSGYALKNIGKNELVQVIESVNAGKKHFNNEIPGLVSGRHIRTHTTLQKRNATLDLLTRRELEVLKGIAGGLSNSKLGKKLGISPRTVDTHRTNLMKKIKVHNIAGLVRYAIKNGLLN
ncbi:MAG: response regulator transcription factor [Flavobacteriales bacterium]|nr:response regulator transcription factor [Flavobacteriales bacterium]